jgi:uncharacterized protein YfcZ (UPF0381/DUF406 family)
VDRPLFDVAKVIDRLQQRQTVQQIISSRQKTRTVLTDLETAAVIQETNEMAIEVTIISSPMRVMAVIEH